MPTGVTFDLSTFREGLRAKLAVTKKTEAEVLNQAAKNICLRAVSFTPKANKGAIRALDVKIIAGAVAKKLRGGHGGKIGISGREFAARIKKERARRIRSVAYVSAGWVKAGQGFGGGLKKKVSAKGNAGKSYGKKATDSTLAAIGANLANGASVVGARALQEAADFVGRDMLSYAQKKLARALK